LQDWDCDPLDRRAVEVNVGKTRLTFEGTEPKPLTIEIEKDRGGLGLCDPPECISESRDPKTPFDVETATMLGSSGCTAKACGSPSSPAVRADFHELPSLTVE